MIDNTFIIGIGNPFRRDDGIGHIILKTLKKDYPQINAILSNEDTDGLDLLEKIKQYKNTIIVDAVEMGEKPGSIKIFTPNEAQFKIKSDSMSTHGIGLPFTIKLMEQIKIKRNVIVIGIQTKDITYGEGLSPELKNSVSSVCKKILEILKTNNSLLETKILKE